MKQSSVMNMHINYILLSTIGNSTIISNLNITFIDINVLLLGSINKSLNSITSFIKIISNFSDTHTVLVATVIGVITGLLIGAPWIRFKVEKLIRNLFFLSLLDIKLKSKQIPTKEGVIILHGISITNKMWFTNTIPASSCSTRVTLNWSKLCNYVGSILWDKEQEVLSPDEFMGKFYKCLIKETSDPSKRNLNIYRMAESTLFIFIEQIDLKDKTDIALNEIRDPGRFYLNSRNLMPELKPGWKEVLWIGSYDFGLIEKLYIEIPKTIINKDSIPISILSNKNRPKCLVDVGVFGIRWPLRLKVYKKYQIKLFKRNYTLLSKEIKPKDK